MSDEANDATPRLRPIGVIRSELRHRDEAPRQGVEGAPDAWLELQAWASGGLDGIVAGDELVIITWFHQAARDILRVHPRGDVRNPLTGVFATRSPDRPNPLGLHPVTVRAIESGRLRIGPIEAIDGTPVALTTRRRGSQRRRRWCCASRGGCRDSARSRRKSESRRWARSGRPT
jgi:tRNA-Thr(GGU) m(6)t(6)A37 methyltransferase TsaA